MKLKLLFFIAIFSSSLFSQEILLGKEIEEKEYTKISDILNNPDSFLGKRVLVTGEIIEVCEAAGCWMELKSNSEGKLKVKVKDGEIVFPVESKGDIGIVEGELYKMELDEEMAKAYMKHLSEDAGKEFDESTVTGPMTIYQLKGLGAKILKANKDAK